MCAHMVGGVIAAQVCNPSYLQEDESVNHSHSSMVAQRYSAARAVLSRGLLEDMALPGPYAGGA